MKRNKNKQYGSIVQFEVFFPKRLTVEVVRVEESHAVVRTHTSQVDYEMEQELKGNNDNMMLNELHRLLSEKTPAELSDLSKNIATVPDNRNAISMISMAGPSTSSENEKSPSVPANTPTYMSSNTSSISSVNPIKPVIISQSSGSSNPFKRLEIVTLDYSTKRLKIQTALEHVDSYTATSHYIQVYKTRQSHQYRCSGTSVSNEKMNQYYNLIKEEEASPNKRKRCLQESDSNSNDERPKIPQKTASGALKTFVESIEKAMKDSQSLDDVVVQRKEILKQCMNHFFSKEIGAITELMGVLTSTTKEKAVDNLKKYCSIATGSELPSSEVLPRSISSTEDRSKLSVITESPTETDQPEKKSPTVNAFMGLISNLSSIIKKKGSPKPETPEEAPMDMSGSEQNISEEVTEYMKDGKKFRKRVIRRRKFRKIEPKVCTGETTDTDEEHAMYDLKKPSTPESEHDADSGIVPVRRRDTVSEETENEPLQVQVCKLEQNEPRVISRRTSVCSTTTVRSLSNESKLIQAEKIVMPIIEAEIEKEVNELGCILDPLDRKKKKKELIDKLKQLEKEYEEEEEQEKSKIPTEGDKEVKESEKSEDEENAENLVVVTEKELGNIAELILEKALEEAQKTIDASDSDDGKKKSKKKEVKNARESYVIQRLRRLFQKKKTKPKNSGATGPMFPGLNIPTTVQPQPTVVLPPGTVQQPTTVQQPEPVQPPKTVPQTNAVQQPKAFQQLPTTAQQLLTTARQAPAASLPQQTRPRSASPTSPTFYNTGMKVPGVFPPQFQNNFMVPPDYMNLMGSAFGSLIQPPMYIPQRYQAPSEPKKNTETHQRQKVTKLSDRMKIELLLKGKKNLPKVKRKEEKQKIVDLMQDKKKELKGRLRDIMEENVDLNEVDWESLDEVENLNRKDRVDTLRDAMFSLYMSSRSTIPEEDEDDNEEKSKKLNNLEIEELTRLRSKILKKDSLPNRDKLVAILDETLHKELPKPPPAPPESILKKPVDKVAQNKKTCTGKGGKNKETQPTSLVGIMEKLLEVSSQTDEKGPLQKNRSDTATLADSQNELHNVDYTTEPFHQIYTNDVASEETLNSSAHSFKPGNKEEEGSRVRKYKDKIEANLKKRFPKEHFDELRKDAENTVDSVKGASQRMPSKSVKRSGARVKLVEKGETVPVKEEIFKDEEKENGVPPWYAEEDIIQERNKTNKNIQQGSVKSSSTNDPNKAYNQVILKLNKEDPHSISNAIQMLEGLMVQAKKDKDRRTFNSKMFSESLKKLDVVFDRIETESRLFDNESINKSKRSTREVSPTQECSGILEILQSISQMVGCQIEECIGIDVTDKARSSDSDEIIINEKKLKNAALLAQESLKNRKSPRLPELIAAMKDPSKKGSKRPSEELTIDMVDTFQNLVKYVSKAKKLFHKCEVMEDTRRKGDRLEEDRNDQSGRKEKKRPHPMKNDLFRAFITRRDKRSHSEGRKVKPRRSDANMSSKSEASITSHIHLEKSRNDARDKMKSRREKEVKSRSKPTKTEDSEFEQLMLMLKDSERKKQDNDKMSLLKALQSKLVKQKRDLQKTLESRKRELGTNDVEFDPFVKNLAQTQIEQLEEALESIEEKLTHSENKSSKYNTKPSKLAHNVNKIQEVYKHERKVPTTPSPPSLPPRTNPPPSVYSTIPRTPERKFDRRPTTPPYMDLDYPKHCYYDSSNNTREVFTGNKSPTAGFETLLGKMRSFKKSFIMNSPENDTKPTDIYKRPEREGRPSNLYRGPEREIRSTDLYKRPEREIRSTDLYRNPEREIRSTDLCRRPERDTKLTGTNNREDVNLLLSIQKQQNDIYNKVRLYSDKLDHIAKMNEKDQSQRIIDLLNKSQPIPGSSLSGKRDQVSSSNYIDNRNPYVYPVIDDRTTYIVPPQQFQPVANFMDTSNPYQMPQMSPMSQMPSPNFVPINAYVDTVNPHPAAKPKLEQQTSQRRNRSTVRSPVRRASPQKEVTKVRKKSPSPGTEQNQKLSELKNMLSLTTQKLENFQKQKAEERETLKHLSTSIKLLQNNEVQLADMKKQVVPPKPKSPERKKIPFKLIDKNLVDVDVSALHK